MSKETPRIARIQTLDFVTIAIFDPGTMRGKGEVGILTFAAKQESKSLFMSDTAILSWGLLGPLQQGTTALRSISTTWGGNVTEARYRKHHARIKGSILSTFA